MPDVSNAPVKVLRLYSNDQGESCFDTYEISRMLRNFAPPADPFFVSDVAAATGYVALRLPIGWIGEAHSTPRRQILFCLAGSMEITTSSGEARVIATGDALLMADTTGKGHVTKVTSAGPVDAIIVQLE